MTKEERELQRLQRKAYMERWRAEHKGYGRKLRAWQRQEQAKIKAEWEARKPKKVKPGNTWH